MTKAEYDRFCDAVYRRQARKLTDQHLEQIRRSQAERNRATSEAVHRLLFDPQELASQPRARVIDGGTLVKQPDGTYELVEAR